jgi:hypothetical protein
MVVISYYIISYLPCPTMRVLYGIIWCIYIHLHEGMFGRCQSLDLPSTFLLD